MQRPWGENELTAFEELQGGSREKGGEGLDSRWGTQALKWGSKARFGFPGGASGKEPTCQYR